MTLQLNIKKSDKYEEMLNNAVNRTLKKVFGSTATSIIYTYLFSLGVSAGATNIKS